MQEPGTFMCDNSGCDNKTTRPTKNKWLCSELKQGWLGTTPMTPYPVLTVHRFLQDHKGYSETKHYCSWRCFAEHVQV